MKIYFLFFFLFFSLSAICTAQQRKSLPQTKKSAPKKKKVTETDYPPPIEKLESDTAGTESRTMAIPKIDFDTTASPVDSFTDKIENLLTIIHAVDNDKKMMKQGFMEAINANSDTTSSLIKEFKSKFLQEIETGRLIIWLNRLYVKNFRAFYTPMEIDSMAAFYTTPLGQKVLARQTQIMSIVMSEARKMGSYLGQVLMQEVMNNQSKK